jgi:hypothetical protein
MLAVPGTPTTTDPEVSNVIVRGILTPCGTEAGGVVVFPAGTIIGGVHQSANPHASGSFSIELQFGGALEASYPLFRPATVPAQSLPLTQKGFVENRSHSKVIGIAKESRLICLSPTIRDGENITPLFECFRFSTSAPSKLCAKLGRTESKPLLGCLCRIYFYDGSVQLRQLTGTSSPGQDKL